MKILRAVLRRGSTVESIGFYSVLNANRWFPASRLPDNDYHLGSASSGTAPEPEPGPKALSPSGGQQAPFLAEIAELSAHDRRPVRFVLIVLAAIAITLFVLWCI